ncbi:MAG: SDR family NAD(P)-dependent oxidoreductase [Deltaproteobacteria bacterium]|nr:SDR family NAD(P)-dependent oxidoreductase [Deltaproteobacteria bacterium]
MGTERAAFGRETTTADVLSGVDLDGRSAFVTGASGGLGAETARALAERGASLTLAVRDVEKGQGVAESIRSSTGNPAVEVAELDLTSPASVRACAKGWLAGHDALQLLVNNAGIMACPLARTAEGYELQFATNHLGHFLLTGLLAPALVAGAPGRVVNVSSAGHRFAGVDFDDIHFEHRDYDKWVAYGQSKSANVLFSCELDRRLKDRGVRSFALHPGVIMTELARHLTPADIQELMANSPGDGGLEFKPVEAGAATSVYAATARELEGRGGLYLEDCHVGELVEDEASSSGYKPHAVDVEAARRLWEVSERLLGERFEL